ncbi:MAG: archaea-specific SMC-related protein [Haloplanus sp.]
MASSKEQVVDTDMHISVENIGGIDQTTVDLDPGVNILTGRNATNRTSFLQAIMAVAGSENVSLKGDASRGHVELERDGETFSRTLERAHDSVQFRGDPILDDPALADLFAFLLEDNDARWEVAQSGELREIIMRPVDTRELQTEIEEAKSEKKRIDEELDQIETLRQELPALEERRTQLRERIQRKEETLESKRAELDETDANIADSREQESELEAVMADLQEARSELNDIQFDLETERESLEGLEADRTTVEDKIDDTEENVAGDLGELEAELERLRDHRQSLDATMSQLQRVIEFNEEMLNGTNREVKDALTSDTGTGSVADQLVADTTVCWTCGSEVETDAIEGTIDQLRELWREKTAEHSEIDDEIDEVKAEKQEIESQKRERRNLERQLERLESEIEDRESTIESLEQRRDEVKSQIRDLETRTENLEGQEHDEVLSIHKEVNELEFELDQLNDDLQSVEDKIDDIESRIGRKDELEAERETVKERLTELRTRIETLESESVEQFNRHIDTILEVLQYENLDRIWLERTEQTVREGRRTVQRGSFDLHVVRSTAEGTTYEDTVDHLSESEREVTGLVFALAGYLVHDVYEIVPFMLLDSLEAIDSERIARLISHFEDYVPYLVVALLPEDARALDDEYRRITDI